MRDNGTCLDSKLPFARLHNDLTVSNGVIHSCPVLTIIFEILSEKGYNNYRMVSTYADSARVTFKIGMKMWRKFRKNYTHVP